MKQLIVKPEKCISCRTCELVCSFGHFEQFDPRMAGIQVKEYEEVTLAVPTACRQCDQALCMEACPVQAISRAETGACVIDRDKCIGCKKCTKACPIGAVVFSSRLKKAFKCDLCGGDPQCVKYCPNGALEYVESDKPRDARDIKTADVIAAALGTEG